MQNYQIVSSEGRLKIVNKGTFVISYEVNENLKSDEFIIVGLFTKECPIKEQCITLTYGVSSICESMGLWSSDDVTIEILCGHEKENKIIPISDLKVEGCPQNLNNCTGCKHLEHLYIPSPNRPVSKSNAYVKCGFVKSD